jgi:hypothetical protein
MLPRSAASAVFKKVAQTVAHSDLPACRITPL